MRFLIISRYPPFPGGRENFVLELVYQLSKNNKILVLTPDKNSYKIGNLTIKKYPRTKKDLENVIKQFNPDIINSHTFYLSLDALDISKKLNIPFGITLHGDQFSIGDKQRQEIVKEVADKSDFVINVSKNGKESLLKNTKEIEENKVFVVKNGVNLEKFKKYKDEEKEKIRKSMGINKDKIVILSPTRIASYKGLDFLIETIIENKEFLEKNKVLFLISVPDYTFSDDEDSLFDILKNKINKNHIKDLVKFVFLRYEKVKIAYCVSDLFLLPSQKEQFPISILEAMAFQIPIIATKVGGIPELLKNNQDSILVNFSDRKNLIKAIKLILKNGGDYLVKNAFKKVRKSFSISKVSSEYLSIYKKYAKNKDKTNKKNIYTDKYVKDREKLWNEKVREYKKNNTPLWNGDVYYLDDVKDNIVSIGLCEYKDLIFLDELCVEEIKDKYKLNFNFIYINVQVILCAENGKYLFGTSKKDGYTEIIAVGGTLRLEDGKPINNFIDIKNYMKKELEIETKIAVEDEKIEFIDIVNKNNICTFLFKYELTNPQKDLLNIGEFDGEIYLKKDEIFNSKKLKPNDRLKSIESLIKEK